MNNESRSQWYLLTGLVIGLALGLVVAWVMVPVELIDTQPVSMRAEFKDDYRILIASAYIASGDLGRAQARLALLGDADTARTLAVLAQRTLAEGGSEDAARSLGLLATALQSGAPAVPVAGGGTVVEPATATVAISASPEVGDATVTLSPTHIVTGTTTPDLNVSPSATFTPLPTQTPTATPGAPFALATLSLVCDPELVTPQIMVYAFDAAGAPVPGVAIIVSWDGGENRFFTGLKPEISRGYADFEMAPDTIYTLRLDSGGDPVSGLAATQCEAEGGGDAYLGSWQLEFRQPIN